MSLKSEILQGTAPKPFQSKKLKREVMLRTLTSGQWEEVQTLVMSGQNVTLSEDDIVDPKKSKSKDDKSEMQITVDLGKLMQGEFEAMALAVAYAIVDDEPWTPEDAKALPHPEAIEEISDEVFKRSGVSLEAVRSFR